MSITDPAWHDMMRLMRSASADLTVQECHTLAQQLRECKLELVDPADARSAELFALYLDALAERLATDARPA